MDVGQSTAIALWQDAEAGRFKLEGGAAQACADCFSQFADSLDALLMQATPLHQLEGFGGFGSSMELQSGFGGKGARLTEVLVGMQSAALQMKAAYLLAGGKVIEADAANTQAIKAAESELG